MSLRKKTQTSQVVSLLALSTLIFTLGATGWSIWSTIQQKSKVPQRATWQQAASYIKEHWHAGDRVTWYPNWAGEARLALHGLDPILLPHQGEVDVGRARRLWVLGAFGYDGTQLIQGDHIKTLQPLKLVSSHKINGENSGSVVISLLKLEQGDIKHDLMQDLHERSFVEVLRTPPQRSRKNSTRPIQNIILDMSQLQICDLWALKGWHCPQATVNQNTRISKCLNQSLSKKLQQRSKRRDLYSLDRRRWLPYIDCGLHPTEHVSLDWRVIGEEPRRCLWIAPHDRRQVVIKWTPLYQENEPSSKMWLAWGWEDLAVRHPFRTSQAKSLDLSINQGMQAIWQKKLVPKLGWHQVQFPVEAPPKIGPPAPLFLSVNAPQGIADASLCIDLTIRSPIEQTH